MASRLDERRWFGRGRTRALLSVGIVLSLGVVGTWASWTDSSQVDAGTLTAGELDLQLDADLAGPGGTTTRAWSASDLIPGIYRSFTTTVRNTGDVGFTYALTVAGESWTFDPGAVSVVVSSGTANADGTCTGGPIGPTTRTIPAAGPLLTARTLTTGASEPICLRIGLVAGAASSNQGESGTVRFTFTADQVPS